MISNNNNDHQSTTLVNAVDDAELRLVRWLVNNSGGSIASTFGETCQQCIMKNDAAALVQTVVTDAGAITALLRAPSTEEALSAISLLAALTPPSMAVGKLVAALQDSHAGDDSLTLRRVALLSALYNTRTQVDDKCLLLTALYTLAGQSALLLGPEKPLGKWLDGDAPLLLSMVDGAPVSSKRALLTAVVNGVSDKQMKQKFRLLLLETYKNAVSAF